MKKEPFTYSVERLYYTQIENPILKHYNLGTQNSSNVPANFNLLNDQNNKYNITGSAKRSLTFRLSIKETEHGYEITCIPL